VCELAADLRLVAVVSSTQSGATARAVARHRPRAPIVAVTPVAEVARQLMIVWGVLPQVIRPSTSIEDMIGLALAAARDTGAARLGDMVAVTAGVALNQPGTTDLIQVRPVP
jgi:pyruvate kinase